MKKGSGLCRCGGILAICTDICMDGVELYSEFYVCYVRTNEPSQAVEKLLLQNVTKR
jgi:hypothetical protein